MSARRFTNSNFPSSHFLVTGGAGFIGSHIADRLVREGHRVRVLDDFSTGCHENLARIAGRAQIISGSVLDENNLATCMSGVTYVLHQAALPSVARSIENPAKSLEVNALGTLRVLMAALQAGVKRVVIASSSSVYGANMKLPKQESMVTLPISPYAASKLTAEHYAYVYYRVHGLQTIALRYFNVFGPRQDPNSPYAAVIPKFIRAMSQGESPRIHGDGKQSRDFTYVENIVESNLLACKAPAKACGKVYNIAGGSRVTLLDLVRHLNKLLNTRLLPVCGPERPGDVKHSCAAVEQAKRHLGYRLRVPFAEGLSRTVGAFDAECTVEA